MEGKMQADSNFQDASPVVIPQREKLKSLAPADKAVTCPDSSYQLNEMFLVLAWASSSVSASREAGYSKAGINNVQNPGVAKSYPTPGRMVTYTWFHTNIGARTLLVLHLFTLPQHTFLPG